MQLSHAMIVCQCVIRRKEVRYICEMRSCLGFGFGFGFGFGLGFGFGFRLGLGLGLGLGLVC